MDQQTALKTFEQVEASETLTLTANEASKLVLALSKHKLHDQCAQLVRSCQEHGVSLQPSARINGFGVSWRKEDYDAVLREFDALKSDDRVEMLPWIVAGALDAAVKLDRPETVKTLFQLLLGDSKGDEHEEKVEASGDTVAEMLKQVRGVKLPVFAFQALAVYAEKSQQVDMALEVLAMMKEVGVEPTVDVYSSLFVACGKENRWTDAMDVFEGMPQSMLSKLGGTPLAYIIAAHSKSKSEELVLRGLDIYGAHMNQNWGTLACSAALEGLLRTRQYDVLHALANDMRRRQVNWTPFVYKLVALAHIRQGAIETARKLLHDNVKQNMRGAAADCYRELITHYANTGGDAKEACQLYLEMIQNRMQLSYSDWANALELSLQLADHTLYWSFRKQMSLYARQFEKDLPADLLLPNLDAPEPKLGAPATASVSYPDVALALKTFGEIQEANGAGLSVNVASRLLAAMAQANRADDCVKMWRYFEQQGVLPKAFARAAAFRVLSSARKLDHALEMFRTLMHDEVPPGARAYSKALGCAVKLKRYSFFTEILRHLEAHSVTMAAKDVTNVIASCIRAKEWALALGVVSSMKRQGLEPAASTFNSLLAGCATDSFWNMVIEVYNGMPEDRQLEMNGRAVAAVLTAFSRADSDELRARAAEVYKKYRSCEAFPFEAATAAFLQAKQFEDVLAVASEATRQEFEWTPVMYRSVVMANIRSGAMEHARDLLLANVQRMGGCSVECYRELVRYYADVRGDVLEASTLCLQMMQNNADATVDDWRVALELALRIPDHSIYWELRKWLRLHGNTPLSDLREHLLLPDDDLLH
jgi:pentatricopeptide repeat protein